MIKSERQVRRFFLCGGVVGVGVSLGGLALAVLDLAHGGVFVAAGGIRPNLISN